VDKAQKKSVSPSSTTRIFIVDDHPMIREGISQMVQAHNGMVIVGEASGAPKAISGIRDTHPDLLICDLSLAEGDGLELIKDVSARWPQVRILVASMHTDPTYAERAIRAGAAGYITKDQPQEEMLEAISKVLRGRLYVRQDLSDLLVRRAVKSEDGTTSPATDDLSDRELQVFDLLGDGLSTREIAARLSLSVKTIETYRDNIRQKLSLKNSNQLLHRAISWKMERRLAPDGPAANT
jgi:DNA-binding NarL/FixJ family response regulator